MSSITRRAFVQASAAGAAAQVPASVRPNVLFIMLDQWRFDCLGANGNRDHPDAHTRLAGLAFGQLHAGMRPGACLCSLSP